MAVIKAFKGMRYNTAKAGEISSLCCPPYDIISEQERLAFIKENEYNIIRLELPKEGENPYACASDILKMWQDKGILKIEDKPAIYIYEEEFSVGNTRKSIKGIIARVQLEEFSKGIILPHEFTLSKAKEDRLNLMKATNCNFSQIYALYMDENIQLLLPLMSIQRQKPTLNLQTKQVLHIAFGLKPTKKSLRSLLPILQTENYILPTVTTDTKPLSITEIIAEKTAFQSRAIRRTSR